MRPLTRTVLAIAVVMPSLGRAATVSVTIDNYAFAPKTVTVRAGDTIVWTDRDDVAHTVTALGNGFDSGAVEPGHTYRHRFTKPGTYAYRCSLHPEMRGTILVDPAS